MIHISPASQRLAEQLEVNLGLATKERRHYKRKSMTPLV